MTILATKRLVLRELATSDIDFIASLLADTDVMRYFGRTYDRAGATAWVERQQSRYARDGYGYWLAERAEDGEPIGQVGLMQADDPELADPSLGYIIATPFWRRGYATEAAIGCRDHAFTALGATRVITLVRPENEPSLAVARRAGFRPVSRRSFAGFEHILLEAGRPGREQPDTIAM